ncbi:3-ketodihydrosphingosine reductase-like, partial [Ruditapes philippinarum]|uniref:3-ketodihydrosphingosine reductase-like n=1 Tax=Ruditapes philippinarum TaxID=129788 RepID=UPI00295A58D9
MFWSFLIVTLVLLLFIYIAGRLKPKSATLAQKHVVVTGGSSGIGKAIAVLAAQQGANVTILARNKLRLEEAKTEIQGHLKPNGKVQSFSVDLSTNYDDVKKCVTEAEEKFGPVFMLVNSAGTSVSRSFQDLDASEFKKLMEANYYSAVNATKASIDSMVEQQAGRVVFLSSQAGQIGLFGFSAYSASKFALRGLAEALQMEMTPHNVRVTVAFPPDTDTPGFQHELQGKPKETMLISETAGLLKPQDVAHTIISDSLKGEFTSYQGIDGW